MGRPSAHGSATRRLRRWCADEATLTVTGAGGDLRPLPVGCSPLGGPRWSGNASGQQQNTPSTARLLAPEDRCAPNAPSSCLVLAIVRRPFRWSPSARHRRRCRPRGDDCRWAERQPPQPHTCFSFGRGTPVGGPPTSRPAHRCPVTSLCVAHGQTTRAIGIAAPAGQVWPWLVQIGFGRAGWYSYDWIDNDRRPSASTIRPTFRTSPSAMPSR